METTTPPPRGRSCSRRETPSGTVTSCVPPRGRRGGRIGRRFARDAHRRIERLRRRLFRKRLRPAVHPGGQARDAAAGASRSRGVRVRAGWTAVAVTGDCSLVVWELGTPGREAETMRCPSLRSSPDPGRARAAHGGRAPRQVRLARRAVRGWARVRFPSGSEMLGARRIVPSRDRSSPRGFARRAAGGGGGGELHALQVAAARAAVGMGPSALLSGVPRTAPRDRPTPECLLSAAEMMGSQAEYRTWLRAYVRTSPPRAPTRRRPSASSVTPCWVLSARAWKEAWTVTGRRASRGSSAFCFARRCFRRWRRTARVRGWWARWTSCWKSRRSARGETLRGAARDGERVKARHL